MADEKLHIKVEYSQDGLFGATSDDELAEIDIRASMNRFGQSLNNYLYDAYPKAQIQVIQGTNDRHTVNGRGDHDECPWVGQLIEKCWNGDDWLEYK